MLASHSHLLIIMGVLYYRSRACRASYRISFLFTLLSPKKTSANMLLRRLGLTDELIGPYVGPLKSFLQMKFY